MTPFIRRNFLRGLSILLFAGVLYGFNKFIPALGNRIQHVEFVAISILLLGSLIVMFFWSLFGVFGGLASFLLAMIFLYKPVTDLNPYYYSVLIVAFFLNSYMGYWIYRRTSTLDQKSTVLIEKIQEDTNLIRNHMNSRRAEVAATGDKVSSMIKLKSIADSLSLSLSKTEITRIVAEETFKLFGAGSRVLLFLLDKDANELVLSRTAKDTFRKSFAIKRGSIFDKWVLKNMKSLLVKDVKKDFRFSMTEEEQADDAVSIIIKPLAIDDNVFGIIRVDSPDESVFEQHELRILDIIGDLAAVAFENAHLYRQIEELAIKDSLTGLFVHRYFMERLDEEIKRALRSDSQFALLMIDIDDFKGFNDKYGHISGDVILKNISSILESKLSAGDIVARYGGEEFVFLALNCNKKEAFDLAESIREEIQKKTIVLRGEECFVTVSIGVAFFPEDAKLREDIIWEADRRMYEAKAKGKNIVCSK